MKVPAGVLVALSLFLATVPTAAQESRPASAPASRPAAQEPPHDLRQDPKAVAFLEAGVAKIYRARDGGLKDLKVKVTLSEQKDGALRELGSFRFEWTAGDKTRVTDVVNLKTIPTDVLLEMLGPETLKSAKQNHIAFLGPTVIELRAPEWASPRPLDHFVLTFDEKGLLQKQEVYDAPDHQFQTTTFTLAPIRDRYLITRRDHARSGLLASSDYQYREIDGVTLMTQATIKTASASTTVVTFSEHAVNKGLVIN